MKLSPNFGEGGIKGWFVQNVEKVVLGMVGVIVIMYIWSGAKHQTIDPTKSSESLQKAATLASGHIDVTKWDTIKEERFPIADNWEEMVTDSNIKVDKNHYPLPTIWNPPLFPLSTKRYDPPLLPLEEIHAIAGIGAFETLSDGDDGATPRRGREGSEAVFRPGDASADGARFAVITALIPTKKQTVKYKEKLEEAAGYDEARDTPKYFFFDVQRLEVTADGKPVTKADGKPATWTTIGNEDTLKKVNELWSARSEVVDKKHVHEWLTMRPAPLLGETQDKFFVHPAIGRRIIEDPETEEGRQIGHNQGHRTPVRVPGRDGPVRGGRDDVNNPAPTTNAITPYEEPEIEYHLFRFYDVETNYDDVTLAPQAGKRYKYKVQVLLEDPNNPQEENNKPLDQDLHKDVLARIKLKPTDKFRATAFSSESEIVEFPVGIRVLAGAVGVGPVDPYVPFTLEPKTRILGIVWDNREAAPVHGLFGNEDQKQLDKELRQASAYRGQVLNTAKDVMKLDPFDDVSTELEYDVRTDAILLDIRGGHRLSPKPSGYSLLEPGELLLLDRNGRLIVQEEATDWREFDKLRPPVVEEEENGDREIGGELLD